jgi:hypothetical protein
MSKLIGAFSNSSPIGPSQQKGQKIYCLLHYKCLGGTHMDTQAHVIFKTIINSALYDGFNLGLSGKRVSKGCLVCTAM